MNDNRPDGLDTAEMDYSARYRTLFESIDEGFCIIEFFDGPHGPLSDYVHVEANPAYATNTGIPDVVGRKVREMVPDEADGWVALYGNVLRTGEPIRFERELVATGRHLELSAFRVEPASRKQVAVLFKDVTARKRAELELRRLNETLEARVAEAIAERMQEQERLREAEEALRQAQKMEAVGQLTGGLAHDFAASFGSASTSRGRPVWEATSSATRGMRLEPPTSTTPARSPAARPAEPGRGRGRRGSRRDGAARRPRARRGSCAPGSARPGRRPRRSSRCPPTAPPWRRCSRPAGRAGPGGRRRRCRRARRGHRRAPCRRGRARPGRGRCHRGARGPRAGRASRAAGRARGRRRRRRCRRRSRRRRRCRRPASLPCAA